MKLVCDIEVALLAMMDYNGNSIVNHGKSTMKEIWKDAVGFESTHRVSNLGRVAVKERTISRTRHYVTGDVHQTYKRKGHILKLSYSLDGYLQLSANNTTYKAHRWVAQTFIPNPENKPQVNHIDGVKDNNVLSNLEWCTARENVIHSYKTGLACNAGSRHPRSKLCEEEILEIRARRSEGISAKTLAGDYSVCVSTISKILTGKYWGHV